MIIYFELKVSLKDLQMLLCHFCTLRVGIFYLQETDRAKEQLKTALSVLNQYLETRTFLVGERITQADITVACDLLLAYQYVS